MFNIKPSLKGCETDLNLVIPRLRLRLRNLLFYVDNIFNNFFQYGPDNKYIEWHTIIYKTNS